MCYRFGMKRSPCPLCAGDHIVMRPKGGGVFQMLCRTVGCGYAVEHTLRGESGLTERERLVTFWNVRADALLPKKPDRRAKEALQAALNDNWAAQGSFRHWQPSHGRPSAASIRRRSNKA